jgi:hypothetical protein
LRLDIYLPVYCRPFHRDIRGISTSVYRDNPETVIVC